MKRGGGQGAVVVAVDDDGTAGHAVDWAAAEAAVRGTPLRIVHAFIPPLSTDAYGVVPLIDSFAPAHTAAELVLQDAVVRARTVASDIAVSTRLVHGSAGWTSIHESRDAQLLVVGNHRRSRLRDLLAGSLAAHVATHASCPVVVIRPAGGTDGRGAAPRAVARVVVGVDRTPSCTRAIGFAFQAARQRGIPLTALHAWTPDAPANVEAISGAATTTGALASRAVTEMLARWCDEYADVPVITKIVPGDPARALVAESRGAALVVVGSRGRRHILRAVFGSVGQTVLRHAHCPIAIVRPGCTTTPQPPTQMRRERAS